MDLTKIVITDTIQLKINCKKLFSCFVSVPPLEGFVMNRVQGDYFETLLYKIFVSIDEQTNVSEVGF